MFGHAKRQTQPFWLVWVTTFAFACLTVAVNAFEADQFLIFFLFPIAAAALALAGFGRTVSKSEINSGWWLPMLPLGLLMIWYMFICVFGQFSISAILFHFQYDLDSNGVAGEIAYQIFSSSLPFGLIFVCWTKLSRGGTVLQRLGKILFVPLMLLNPFTLAISTYVASAYASQSLSLLQYYVDPRLAHLDEGIRKNLVHIYLESTERTLWDERLFDDVAAPLKRLEANGFSATGLDQAELTGWTLAGVVSSGCGVPLFNLGALNGNKFEHTTHFMPSAFCLGDLLSRDGYDLVFIKGAQLSFAGTDRYLHGHGFKNAFGYDELAIAGKSPPNAWGLDDEDVFGFAFREIERLSKSARPFDLTLTTLGGHSPSGYVSRSCKTRPEIMKHESDTMQAFACTNRLTEEFVQRLSNAGLLENTVVVIQSDHLAMRNEISRKLQSEKRHNTFIVIAEGLAGKTSSVGATMIDAYPTILEALGYTLPDHRAGLGVSLLSDRKPLMEAFGLNELNKAIVSDTALRDRLWNLKARS
ncbi:sulfatase-like hydrolase/transferase [Rhizobium sp. Root1220]|uniref:sulfatase-like hydrolase/transferase n=1 Tax=Rhizobium sp. Root1220 TaxID=1736432 RepID=UPI0006FA3FB6|nr:sulfatase-like hydrolase/transferase [Rhizobium sp. Root1220]KQV66197.1 hypothetical protein ASC90_13475 [Rhizobium sp. Root1220]